MLTLYVGYSFLPDPIAYFSQNQSNRYSRITQDINPLTPNDDFSGGTAPLTSKRCILYIYSTNIVTEYFKHGIYCPSFLFKMQFVS